MVHAVAVLLLLACCSTSMVLAAPRIPAPCSACKAVASSLQSRLDSERVRNHLDLRGRLDDKGQRHGKVLEYRVSELRVLELLEGLCTSIPAHTLITITVNATDDVAASKTRHWGRTATAAAGTRPSKDEEDMRTKQLASYCGALLDEFDEELTAAIQTRKLENGVESWLCFGPVLNVCPVGGDGGGSKVSGEQETPDSTTVLDKTGTEADTKTEL